MIGLPKKARIGAVAHFWIGKQASLLNELWKHAMSVFGLQHASSLKTLIEAWWALVGIRAMCGQCSDYQPALLHMPRIRSRISAFAPLTEAVSALPPAAGQVTRSKCEAIAAGINRVRPA